MRKPISEQLSNLCTVTAGGCQGVDLDTAESWAKRIKPFYFVSFCIMDHVSHVDVVCENCICVVYSHTYTFSTYRHTDTHMHTLTHAHPLPSRPDFLHKPLLCCWCCYGVTLDSFFSTSDLNSDSKESITFYLWRKDLHTTILLLRGTRAK